MRRLRLASLLALVFALTGGFATPGPTARATRLVTEIAWYQAAPVKPPSKRHTPVQIPRHRRERAASPMVAAAPRVPSATLAYSLYQRPPPARA